MRAKKSLKKAMLKCHLNLTDGTLMKIESIDINKTLENARQQLAEDKSISLGLKSLVELLLVIITLLSNRLNLNSRNSSKPPSTDKNRKKENEKASSAESVGKLLINLTPPPNLWVIY